MYYSECLQNKNEMNSKNIERENMVVAIIKKGKTVL